jgi:hypothetical protein
MEQVDPFTIFPIEKNKLLPIVCLACGHTDNLDQFVQFLKEQRMINIEEVADLLLNRKFSENKVKLAAEVAGRKAAEAGRKAAEAKIKDLERQLKAERAKKK